MSHAHPVTEQLTDLRRAAGIDRRVLAGRIGVRTQLLLQWEAGVYAPGMDSLLGWAGGLRSVVAVHPHSGLPILDVDPVGALTAVRQRRRLSQAEVAEAAGFTQPQLSLWERRRHQPGLRALADWAAAVGCDLVLVPALVGVAA
ncbi:putative DNA-binding protein [Actinoplanes missouriensis 431]|uniref:Putative DNA-binding protein n=1 Tax=Actinoplanes missouriensis (strain ATCC 14538 / DSM 43046 / CBS 188.64 / JCM 3121 / NBRC 102363 / NCIMB 12654 / NRRL B-3342 / UNCC 431) TaxID=512565 RepID=I0H2W2_ACTM4|nr:helix-turn-helix transcriptional regulator [Actinoplanes missouriensis]BAL87349.1 putative DNA-binding protein [Actinoplanes missouriensis 431]